MGKPVESGAKEKVKKGTFSKHRCKHYKEYSKLLEVKKNAW